MEYKTIKSNIWYLLCYTIYLLMSNILNYTPGVADEAINTLGDALTRTMLAQPKRKSRNYLRDKFFNWSCRPEIFF